MSDEGGCRCCCLEWLERLYVSLLSHPAKETGGAVFGGWIDFPLPLLRRAGGKRRERRAESGWVHPLRLSSFPPLAPLTAPHNSPRGPSISPTLFHSVVRLHCTRLLSCRSASPNPAKPLSPAAFSPPFRPGVTFARRLALPGRSKHWMQRTTNRSRCKGGDGEVRERGGWGEQVCGNTCKPVFTRTKLGLSLLLLMLLLRPFTDYSGC